MEVKKIVEGMTAQQVAQVIDDNFKAQNKILEDDIATQNSVIGVSEYKDFSEGESVSVGDVRKYGGFLYECVKATSGAWDENKWKKTSFKANVEKNLSGMEEKIKLEINGGVKEYNIPFVTGRYINQYGQETSNGNPIYARTEPIYLKSGVVLNFGKYNFITVGYRTGTSGGYSVKKSESSITETLTDSYTTELDGYYVISSYTSAFEAYPPSYTETIEGLKEKVESLLGNEGMMAELPELIKDVKGNDFIIYPTIVKGSYVNTYGLTSNTNNPIDARTEPYWIEKGTKVIMKTNTDGYCAIGYRTGTSGGYSIVTKGEVSDELKEYTWISTLDCYVVFSSLTEVFEQYQPRIYKVEAVSLTEIRETLNELYKKSVVEALPITAPTREKVILGAGKKVILYGDSISYTSHNDRYKTLMEEYTNSEVYAAGYDGASTAMLASDAVLERIWNYEPDLIIIEVGGNDTGQSGTVGTFGAIDNGEPLVEETDINVDYSGTYFIQAVSHILRKVKDYYYNIIERAGVTLPTTSNEDRAKIEAVKKPTIAIWTTLPQKRLAGYYSNPDCWLRKRNAIVECCNKYDILCIDIWAYNGIDWDLEPIYNGEYWQRLNGIYTHDGVHPNPWGYEKICKVIAGALL